MKELMDIADIPSFVGEVLALGFDISAIGDRHFVIDDAPLSRKVRASAMKRLLEVRAKYGREDHLRKHLTGYLHQIGRGRAVKTDVDLRYRSDPDFA